MAGNLFDSLVSVRSEAGAGDRSHLGLGLYIVRVIAEVHRGWFTATNTENADGVVFTVLLHQTTAVKEPQRGH